MSDCFKVAVVNDSVMARESMRQVIQSDSRYTVAWMAEDGAEAVRQAESMPVDIILMDLIMPVMNGVEATRHIMAQSPCAILVVTASVNNNAAQVFEAMGAGALDAINTPVLSLKNGAEGQAVFLQKIATVTRLIDVTQHNNARENLPRSIQSVDHQQGDCLVCIGASTGGPSALRELLSDIPADFPAPIVIIQHVDEEFAASFADWLNSEVAIPVRLAQEGDRLVPGRVLIAGRGQHLVIDKHHRLHYTPEPESYAYRPSVNVFFESVAEHWQKRAIGVLLTGMGRDGAAGLLALKQAGCHTIAQDQATSAIYGMPKAAAELDAASTVLPLAEIGTSLLDRIHNCCKTIS